MDLNQGLTGPEEVTARYTCNGWASLARVEHYVQMVDDDLLQAHKAHSPVDNL